MLVFRFVFLLFCFSSSGQPENPLLLLGQYSDEDSEVDSDKKSGDRPIGEASSPGNKDEV